MVQQSDVIARIVEQNLGAYRAMPSRLQEDVSQESQVASDYRGRLVYELLQNADDAMSDDATMSDRVAFLVSDDELWIANTGRALTDSDVLGLCGLGASSKVDAAGNRRASIGHKGLGFKSILEVTDAPCVFSRTTSFSLGADQARPLVRDLWKDLGLPAPRAVPAMRFPAHVSELSDRWSRYQAEGFNTAFRFPFKAGSRCRASRAAVADLLLGLPLTTVLFLKNLEEITVRVEQRGRYLDRIWSVEREWLDTDGNWTPTTGFAGSGTYRVSVTDGLESARFLVAHNDKVRIGEHRAGLSGPAWEGVDLAEVSVAAPEPGSEPLPDEWRHFHVFLPTAEHCPYPLLINGAFATDLSRQQVRITGDAEDYNAHLIRHAAKLVASEVVPLLRPAGAEAVLTALDRRASDDSGGAAGLLHEAVTAELADVPLLPAEDGTELVLADTVLPTALLAEDGESFRWVLRADASWDDRRFPAAEFCAGHWARIAADHGATELSPDETLAALAHCQEPERSASRDDESSGFELDPLLELASLLWTRAGAEEREALEHRARNEPLFPVQRRDDRSLERVALGDTPAFFPPQSARTAIALPDLRFMAHPLCWGALNKKERAELLEDRMNTWASLFGVREFRFETVVQAAVLPALVLKPDQDALNRLHALRDPEALATICQLAGRFAKPDRPLRYQRLQSDRALVNLSRLPVPCRTADGEERWLPAHRVYFGADWLGAHSIEQLDQALPDNTPATFEYLAPPATFLGLLGDYAQSLSTDNAGDNDDEVDVDEDADQAIESSERDRWAAFLSWIGVNRCIRPVHFHDVEDDATGWLTTKDLARPSGWAFQALGETWDAFAASLRARLNAQHDLDAVTPYLYEAHDLDQIVAILDAASADASSQVARALFEHLARHWPWLAPFADCQIALVERGKSPNQRSKPQRALAEELADGGDNLWIQRLRSRSVCPTRLGPRPPALTWRQTAELERRFSRRGRSSATLLPVLDVPEVLPTGAIRALSERLGIRAEPSPSTFTAEDADRLCTQLQTMFPGAIEATDLREVIKPVYRQMFELLSGRASKAGADHSLSDTPLLAKSPNGLRFLPASQMLYASTPGIRERSGVAGSVATFILEAEAPASAPLRTLFGMRVLEDALEWRPDPGGPALDADELATMRAGLTDLLLTLLARIRTERTNLTDLRVLREFVQRVEPVETLALSCTLDGAPVTGLASRPYFVQVAKGAGPLQAFVVWDSASGWPPTPEAAQGLAMALADALGINLVETFLAFIQSDSDQRRRLLDIAGGAELLAEINDELTSAPSEPDQEERPDPSPTANADEVGGEKAAVAPSEPAPAAPPVPLLRFEDLTINGEPVLVAGDVPGHEPGSPNGNDQNKAGTSPGTKRAAPGTDLGELDALGMRIAMSYELLRVRRAGHTDAAGQPTADASTLVVDVHSPALIRYAAERSPVVSEVMDRLEAAGISQLFPGFDILTIVRGKPERLIELKSSGVDARVQVMSWNEWKTARASDFRELFWLYLVGNLRSDLPHAKPYVRAIRDPFGSLVADEFEEQQLRRAVQLRVREFKEAEHLDIGVGQSSP